MSHLETLIMAQAQGLGTLTELIDPLRRENMLLNGRFESGCRRRLSLATAVEVFFNEFGGLFGHIAILGGCQG
jgi:hypothetical protein